MIVLDAPTLCVALLGHDITAERALWAVLAEGPLPLSPPLEAELSTLLARPFIARYLDSGLIADALGGLFARSAQFDPRLPETDCRNPRNNRVLELAQASGAEAIISLNEELLSLQTWRGTRILRPARFLTSRQTRPT